MTGMHRKRIDCFEKVHPNNRSNIGRLVMKSMVMNNNLTIDSERFLTLLIEGELNAGPA